MSRLIAIRGVPGSGKSTFAAKMFPGILHLENDMYHMKNGEYAFDFKKQKEAVEWCKRMCEIAVSLGMDVVVSNTLTKHGHLDMLRQIAARHGAAFNVYRCNGKFKNQHRVPFQVLQNMEKNLTDWKGELNVFPKSDGFYAMTDLHVGDEVKCRDDGSMAGKIISFAIDEGNELCALVKKSDLTEVSMKCNDLELI